MMTTTTTQVKRERRLSEAACAVERLIAVREKTIAKLVRTEARLTGARRVLVRYEKRKLREDEAAPPAVLPAVGPPAPAPSPALLVSGSAPDLEVPDFLKLTGSIGGLTPADLKAREEIAAEQAERKRAKSNNRIAKLKAKKAGHDKPLQGKEALAAIARGHR